MNYKKGILSVVLWFVYTMIVGTGMVGTVMTVLLPEGGSHPVGLVIAGVWLVVTGLVVYLLHKLFMRNSGQQNGDRRQIWLVLEGVLFVALIAAGIVLRTREVMQYDLTGTAGDVWFDAVRVTETTQIPQVVHGAVYIYLQVLHGLLVFLGNKMSVALILQVVLQMLAGIFLYFTVRKLTGTAAAVVAMGYWMLCPVWENVVAPGPESLFLLLWMIGLWAVAGALEHFLQKGAVPGILPLMGFLFSGMIVGALGYLDIMGFLLLLTAFSVLFLETEQKTGLWRRISACLLSLLGALTGFFLCISLDAVSSGKLMENVLLAWWKVCEPKKFSLAVTYAQNTGNNFDFSVIAVVIAGIVLSLGIFSYWCRKRRERQSLWVAVMLVLGLMICCGMTSVEMQGISLLALLLAVAAGAGVQAILPFGTREIPVQDLENEDFPEEAVTSTEEEAPEIQFIENPLPLPKKHVPKVLDYKLNSEDAGDFDYPVAEEDDFDH